MVRVNRPFPLNAITVLFRCQNTPYKINTFPCAKDFSVNWEIILEIIFQITIEYHISHKFILVAELEKQSEIADQNIIFSRTIAFHSETVMPHIHSIF